MGPLLLGSLTSLSVTISLHVTSETFERSPLEKKDSTHLSTHNQQKQSPNVISIEKVEEGGRKRRGDYFGSSPTLNNLLLVFEKREE